MAIVTKAFIKSYFNITGADLDSRIDFFIPIVEKDYLKIRNKDFDVDGDSAIVYPDNADEVSAKMVLFKIQSANSVSVSGTSIDGKKEIKSESWGDHSISYADSLMFSSELKFGYPKNIVDGIVRYVGFVEA
jgi:hypothetical protein